MFTVQYTKCESQLWMPSQFGVIAALSLSCLLVSPQPKCLHSSIVQLKYAVFTQLAVYKLFSLRECTVWVVDEDWHSILGKRSPIHQPIREVTAVVFFFHSSCNLLWPYLLQRRQTATCLNIWTKKSFARADVCRVLAPCELSIYSSIWRVYTAHTAPFIWITTYVV